jgi:hypothetical protein
VEERLEAGLAGKLESSRRSSWPNSSRTSSSMSSQSSTRFSQASARNQNALHYRIHWQWPGGITDDQQ